MSIRLLGRHVNDCDCAIVLTEFLRLRNCPAQIHVLEELKTHAKHLEFSEFVIGLNMPFGTFLAEGHEKWSDDTNAKRLDATFIDLHEALDELRGPTAAMMRLERFAAWYDDNKLGGKSSYLDTMERIMKDSADRKAEFCFEYTIAKIKWRYRLMVAFNPLSAKMQRGLTEAKAWCEQSGGADAQF